jgi:hypothetical protein
MRGYIMKKLLAAPIAVFFAFSVNAFAADQAAANKAPAATKNPAAPLSDMGHMKTAPQADSNAKFGQAAAVAAEKPAAPAPKKAHKGTEAKNAKEAKPAPKSTSAESSRQKGEHQISVGNEKAASSGKTSEDKTVKEEKTHKPHGKGHGKHGKGQKQD